MYDAFEHADTSDHPLDAELARAGYDLEDVDFVVQTHLHVDHAGGLDNFDGTDTPVFVHEEERDRPLVQASTTRLSEEKRKVDRRDSQV